MSCLFSFPPRYARPQRYFILSWSTEYYVTILHRHRTTGTTVLVFSAAACFVDSLALLVLSYPRHYFSSSCRAYGMSIGFTNGRCRNISVPCAVLSSMACLSIISASARIATHPTSIRQLLYSYRSQNRGFERMSRILHSVYPVQNGSPKKHGLSLRSEGPLLSPRSRPQHGCSGTTSRPRKIIEY